ncbi:hypothetical protein SNARM312S_02811 [Streptomyces narbonensis]
MGLLSAKAADGSPLPDYARARALSTGRTPYQRRPYDRSLEAGTGAGAGIMGTTSGSVSRRGWLMLGGLFVLGGSGAVGCASAGGRDERNLREVNTDVEPLERRFRAIGRLSDPHWLGYDPNDSGREWIPDQDPRIRVVGVARLPAGAVRSVVGEPKYAFGPSEPSHPPQELAEFLPEGAGWMGSARYDKHITRSLYVGRFHFSPTTDHVYFDTVNPEIVGSSPSL